MSRAAGRQTPSERFRAGIAARQAPRNLGSPWIYVTAGLAVLALGAWLRFGGESMESESARAAEQAQAVAARTGAAVESFRRTLGDEQVAALATLARDNPESATRLRQYLTGRLGELRDVRVLAADPAAIDPEAIEGLPGYVVLDMLFEQRAGRAPVQVFDAGGEAVLAGVETLREGEQVRGYLLVTVAPGAVLERVTMDAPALGYLVVRQPQAGGPPRVLKAAGDASMLSYGVIARPVPGTLFEVAVPQNVDTSLLSPTQKTLVMALGALLLAFGLVTWQRRRRPPPTMEAESEALSAPETAPAKEKDTDMSADEKRTPQGPMAEGDDAAPRPQAPEPAAAREEGARAAPKPLASGDALDLPELVFDAEERRKRRRQQETSAPPVELTPGIFRAYDIRGVVGETLDAGVARQVGQAIGSLALEKDASPVVVARDGRHSGPALLEGLVEGIASTGCDVVDIGMAPTGVLYYAAFELGSGSGVMVTGSHNPPEYNGIKMVVGGTTLSGDDISALYERIVHGELRVGRGDVSEENVLDRYRERIAGDIQLERPLRVVADCGNGVGGVNAVSVLRAIGADVLPLFDEVDGDFPNHHPDPSEPHNLEDLIESVKLMNADLGVAFDGDADRLGVVTPEGEIVYPDRVMMLLARDVLERRPGATIIYDVKCTGHLDRVIAEAGGKPVMYKTGHSLIKEKMKELDSPFAGEMSGHFFFGERWYGVDDGIYGAARLLEILAKDERSPSEVLGALPTSVSTPELKLQMSEGENHAFVERFRNEAKFEGARVSLIDGLRADWEDGWGLVRASNTTPVVVIRFDADDEAAMKRIQAAFRAQMKAIDETLSLPF